MLICPARRRPFFMVLAGERYGWAPPNYRVSDRPEFDWVRSWPENYSITALEIVYGMLLKPFTPVHALLYQRNPAFMKDVHDKNEFKIFDFDHHGEVTPRTIAARPRGGGTGASAVHAAATVHHVAGLTCATSILCICICLVRFIFF